MRWINTGIDIDGGGDGGGSLGVRGTATMTTARTATATAGVGERQLAPKLIPRPKNAPKPLSVGRGLSEVGVGGGPTSSSSSW